MTICNLYEVSVWANRVFDLILIDLDRMFVILRAFVQTSFTMSASLAALRGIVRCRNALAARLRILGHQGVS
jgi:hypothetical protein